MRSAPMVCAAVGMVVVCVVAVARGSDRARGPATASAAAVDPLTKPGALCATAPIPKPKSRRRDQERIPDLQEAARRNLSRSEYGGVWVAQPSGRITLGVAGGLCAAISPNLIYRARLSLQEAGLEGRAAAVQVERSLHSMYRLRRRLAGPLAEANDGARVSINAGVSPSRNAIVIEAPTRGYLTVRQERFLKRIVRKYGDRLHLGRRRGPLQLL